MRMCPVLMVDDDEVDRYLLKRMLGKLNVSSHIQEATNGQDALDYLQNFDASFGEHPFPPCVIFLDINMPIMNGFEFLEAFSELRQAHQQFTHIRLAMFTSSDNQDDIQKAQQYPFVSAYLLKDSVTSHELEAMLNC